MGIVARVLKFLHTTKRTVKASELTCDPGGQVYLTTPNFSASGDDSYPLEGDEAILIRVPRSGGYVSVGYLDPASNQKTSSGEKRIYSRDLDANERAEIHLKNDGTVVINNIESTITMGPDGTVTTTNGAATIMMDPSGEISLTNVAGHIRMSEDGIITANGATIDTDGTITSPVRIIAPSLIIGGKELADHTHQAGTPPGNTGVNN